MVSYSLFVGIDVSKAMIDVSYRLNGQVLYLGQYLNSKQGFQLFIKDLSYRTDVSFARWFVCFENTGSYSKELLHWLIEQMVPCLEEQAGNINRFLGRRRGKSDKIDSMEICRYAFEKRESLTVTKLDKPFVINIKTLLSRRDLLVKQRTALKISLKEQKSSMDKDLYEELEAQNRSIIKFYNDRIKELEDKIEEEINRDSRAAKNLRLLQSIVGIAKITSAYLISTTNNFESITESRKYASYCGIAPFPNGSGMRKGKMKVNHMANKKVKSVLSNGVLTAIVYDPEISHYYKRKKEEGKPSGVIYNAIKNKLVHRAFAVIKRQTPFVKMMTYA